VTKAGTIDHDWRPEGANPIVTAGLICAEVLVEHHHRDHDADTVATRDHDPSGSKSLAALEMYVRDRAIAENDQERRSEEIGHHLHENVSWNCIRILRSGVEHPGGSMSFARSAVDRSARGEAW